MKFEQLLELAGYGNCIHAEGTRNHLLRENTKDRDRLHPMVRARVEHVVERVTSCLRGADQADLVAHKHVMVGAQESYLQLPPVSARHRHKDRGCLMSEEISRQIKD